MDKINKIDLFEMIGWSEPSAVDGRKAIKWLKSISFENSVYPAHLMTATKPPACVFVPETKLL